MLKLVAICSIFMMIAGYTVVRDTQTRQKNSTLGTSGTSTTYDFTMSGSTTDMPQTKKPPPLFTRKDVEDPPCKDAEEGWLETAFDGQGFATIFSPLGQDHTELVNSAEELKRLTNEMNAKKEVIKGLNDDIESRLTQNETLKQELHSAIAVHHERHAAGEGKPRGLAEIGRELDTNQDEIDSKKASLEKEIEAFETLRGTQASALEKAKQDMLKLKENADKLAKAVAAGVETLDKQCSVAADAAQSKHSRSWSAPSFGFKWSRGKHKHKPEHEQKEDDSEQ